jgi:long-subunit fatty acid transport protein
MRHAQIRALGAALALAVAAPAAGQSGGSQSPLPPSIVLTNYDRVLIGQEEALESGAFTARVTDATAGWYNPAGLALVERSVIGASATGYELNVIDIGEVQTGSGKVTLAQLPSFFGAVLGGDVIKSEKWRVGFSATKPTSWAAAINGATIGNDRYVYSSNVSVSTLVPALSASFAPWRALRFGAGIGVAITSLTQMQIVSAQAADSATTAQAYLRSVDATGVTWGLQGSAGLQWDILEELTFGASLRTPTATLFRSGAIAYQDLVQNGQPWAQVYFRDPAATFTYKLPLDVNLGLAWRRPAWEVELDVRYHAAVSTYAMLSSTRSVDVVTTGPNGEAVRTQVPFTPLLYGATTVWNVAVGGRYNLDEAWSFHGGFYTDVAPVSPVGEDLFRRVNLYGVTAGAKLKGDHLSGSLGLGFSWGNSQPFTVGQTPEGAPVVTTFKIRSVSLLYAISYRF